MQCKKCGFTVRDNPATPIACPKCGAVYAKVERQVRREAEARALEAAKQEEATQQALKRQQAKDAKTAADADREYRGLLRQDRIVTRTFEGEQDWAAIAFKKHAEAMAAKYYRPTAQSYAPGSHGCLSFLIAVLLIPLWGFGLLVLAYLVIVKPPGTLSVAYELQPDLIPNPNRPVAPEGEKQCPQCAESVKSAAIVCRFCNYDFNQEKRS